MDDMSTAPKVWGWLLAACLFVLVGCSILAVNSHNTSNEYQALRAQDIAMLRKEIVEASIARDTQLRLSINNGYEQLKQYIDVQIPLKARDAVSSITPISITQQANPITTFNSK
ncbi:hypothetical protein [Pseudomonas syringae]|uniref:hypothetical protein n=1 Tax=Pseudomonas syringae TaxID=317 RepID=UPI001BCE8508|nr:hypothetical protein [Pseudomonas syringae]MBS7416397.1 hypothetical protein [Pseudomonas syringae]